MKKLELKIGSVKEMLTKEQMKKISGGDIYNCYDMLDADNAYMRIVITRDTGLISKGFFGGGAGRAAGGA